MVVWRRWGRPARSHLMLAAIVLGVGSPLRLPAATIDQLSGTLDVATVQTDVDGDTRHTIRQQHTLNLNHNPVPNVRLRVGASYFRFDVDAAQSENFWRRDVQPSADLAWRHPSFSFTANARRRRSTARVVTTNVTSEDLQFVFRTRPTRWPILTLRYDSGRTHDDEVPRRDTRDRRFRGEIDYNAGPQFLAYRFQNRETENVISSVEGTENRHQLRWSVQPTTRDRPGVHVGWDYTYEHRERTDRRLGSGVVRETVPPTAGLYGEDPSPTLGELESVSGLIDGVLDVSTDPLIDIGGASINRNVGADLRVPSAIDALYIYVDRASGTGVSWEVFVSDDNQSWRTLGIAVAGEFNARSNRYEIPIGRVETRYVKAVNRGLNDVLTVYVTEIEVLQEIPEVDRSRLVSNFHIADLRIGYDVTEKLGSGVEFNYQHLPSGGRRASRDDYGYTVTTDYRPRVGLIHSLRWEQQFQDMGIAGGTDQDSKIATYTLRKTVLPDLEAIASARHQRTSIDGGESERLTSGVVRVVGNPYPAVTTSVRVSRNRAENLLASRRLDSWSYEVAASGPCTAWWDLNAAFGVQESRVRPDDRLSVRRTYRVGSNLRLSRTILLRGSFSTSKDRIRATSHDYVLSWRMAERVNLSGQALLSRSGDGPRSDRYGATLTYGFGGRASAYVSYFHLDQTGADSAVTESFQQGIRYAL